MSKSLHHALLALVLLAAANVSIAEESIAQLARFVSNASPEYPEAERSAGHRGTVKLKLLVDASGSVAEADVSQSSGWPVLDEQALIAAKKWTFIPAEKADGTPVESWVQVPIVFGGRADEQMASEMTAAVDHIITKPCGDFLSEVEKQQSATPRKPPYSSVQSFAIPWSLAVLGLNALGKNVQAAQVLTGRAALFANVLEKCESTPEESYDQVFKASLAELVAQQGQ